MQQIEEQYTRTRGNHALNVAHIDVVTKAGLPVLVGELVEQMRANMNTIHEREVGDILYLHCTIQTILFFINPLFYRLTILTHVR